MLGLVSLVSISASAAPYDLICKNLSPGGNTNVAGVPANGYSVNFEKVTINTADGTSRIVMMPRNVRTFQQFIAIATPAGFKGERLLNGQCGLANAVIPGIPLVGTNGTPVLEFMNFNNMSVYSAKGPGGVSVFATATLPSCPGGLMVFKTNSNAINTTFMVSSAADGVTCL